MSFTDKFIKLPCLIFNPDENDLLGKSNGEGRLITVTKSINPARIESYGETVPISDFREDNKCWTRVVMFSNDDYTVDLTVGEFERLLNNVRSL